MSIRIDAFIFARGGSKGVHKKNIRPLAGRPLIAYAIQAGHACPSIGRVFVSTEDPEIARIAREHGAEVPFMRPAELASDTAQEWLAWKHALHTLRAQEESLPEMMVSLPPTAPLRRVEDVERCIAALQADPDAGMALAVTPVRRHPFFHIVELGPDARVQALSQTRYATRQEAPPAYEITSVAFVAWTRYVLDSPDDYAGRVIGVQVPETVDIDTELDLAFAEFMLQTAHE